ncbi:MAG: ComF family protein [Oscillospiraceae bacterium]
MKNPLKAFLELLFPPKCPFCKRILARDEVGCCSACQKSLPWTEGTRGEVAGEFFSRCVAPLHYRGTVRASILRYKFSGKSAYAKGYGVLTAQCVADRLSGEYDLISWVPLSRNSLSKRGYDQARLLAEETARFLGTSAVPTLEKRRATPAQSTLSEESARRANVMGAYVVIDPKGLRGKRILLVDDVITTGSTLSECARTLRTAGAAEVLGCTLARAGDHQKDKK